MVAALKDIPRHDWNVSGTPLRRIVSLEEFADIAAAMPDEKLELINGEIEMTPPPDNFHIEKSDLLLELFAMHLAEITALNCQLSQSCWFAVPIEMHDLWVREGVRGPSNVGPDVAIRYRDYLQTNRRPPALLVVEVISVSSKREIDRDLISKPDIYATMEIRSWIAATRASGFIQLPKRVNTLNANKSKVAANCQRQVWNFCTTPPRRFLGRKAFSRQVSKRGSLACYTLYYDQSKSFDCG
jgi:Uma2 family endonuclease